LICALSEEEIAKVHALPSAKEIWETLAAVHEQSKEVKKKKSFMPTWEDLDSSRFDSDEEANIGFLADVTNNSISKD